MNPINNAEPEVKTIKVKRKYVRKIKPIVIIEEEEESVSEAETLMVSVVEPEPEPEVEEEDEDVSSQISASSSTEGEPEKLVLPPLENDPNVLREQIFSLQAEIVRLTKYNHDIQHRLETRVKQDKKPPAGKAQRKAKEPKAPVEGKRQNTRAKRPTDYADRYLQVGQVLRWEHKTRECLTEATYIGNNRFTATFSFQPEGEYPEEFASLNAVAGVTLKHLTLRSLNVWATFKTIDGKSVENLDL